MATMVGTASPATAAVTLRPAASFPRSARTAAGQLGRFAVVGCLGTALSAVLYVVLRTWWDAVPANLAAIALSTLVSTEVNRRFTFGGAVADRTREHLQNAGTVLFCAFSSTMALVVLSALVDDPTVLQETVATAAAGVLGGLARFVVLRTWVFGAHATA